MGEFGLDIVSMDWLSVLMMGEGKGSSTKYQPVFARLVGITPCEVSTMRNFGLDILLQWKSIFPVSSVVVVR